MAAASEDTKAGEGGTQGVLAFLRRSRALQVILIVVIAANLAGGGMDGVALAGGLVAAAILGGLTQREFREFGAADGSASDGDTSAVVAETETSR
jgi:hypothetical protein